LRSFWFRHRSWISSVNIAKSHTFGFTKTAFRAVDGNTLWVIKSKVSAYERNTHFADIFKQRFIRLNNHTLPNTIILKNYTVLFQRLTNSSSVSIDKACMSVLILLWKSCSYRFPKFYYMRQRLTYFIIYGVLKT